MEAIVFKSYGGPEVMELTPTSRPAPGPNDVLIRTRAVGLNPVDAMQRNGGFKALDPYTFPKVAGNELSGTVEHVGKSVTRFAEGDKVIARVGVSELGAFADYVAVPADFVAHAPKELDLVSAAGLPLAGLTAQQALGPEHLDVKRGDRVLITGASGGVGLLAVQLAKLAGAHVTATASENGEALVREAGADAVINYKKRSVAEGGERFDKVFDLIGGNQLPELFQSVDEGGAVVSIAGPPTPGSLNASAAPGRKILAAAVPVFASAKLRLAARKAAIRYEFFLMHPDGAGLAELAALIDEGKLALTVDSTYPLERYREAFARLEEGHAKGKIVIDWQERT